VQEIFKHLFVRIPMQYCKKLTEDSSMFTVNNTISFKNIEEDVVFYTKLREIVKKNDREGINFIMRSEFDSYRDGEPIR
jgi:predicted Zn-ribbon and HTH transcriptional regulator